MTDPGVHAVTVCTRATFAAAQRLAASFVAHHTGAATIVVHGDPAAGAAIEIDRTQVVGRPASAPPGASTLVPWAVSAALDAGHTPVVAIAPTALVVRPLTPLLDAAREAGIAVVPRVLAPDDGDEPLDPTQLLSVGVVEPGLSAWAEGPTTRRVLRWWKDAASSGHDARLPDLLPAFGAVVVRDPGLGVTRWNLAERPVQDSAFGPFAGDAPLRTCDLAGLRPEQPPRWDDDGPAPTLDGFIAPLAWQHVVTMGPPR